jgi:hypothetical protein
MPALWAVETIWPFHIDQVVSASLLGTKTFVKFDLTAGEIFVDEKICHNWPPLVMDEASIT